MLDYSRKADCSACPGQRQDVDPRRAHPLQGPRAGIGGSAGGDDVIDDDERVGNAKGSCDVPPPPRRRKPDLARRLPHPAEQEAIDGECPSVSHAASK